MDRVVGVPTGQTVPTVHGSSPEPNHTHVSSDLSTHEPLGRTLVCPGRFDCVDERLVLEVLRYRSEKTRGTVVTRLFRGWEKREIKRRKNLVKPGPKDYSRGVGGLVVFGTVEGPGGRVLESEV